MEAQRIEYLDIAKGLGIILVVIGHTFNGNSMLSYFILTFHMPLFFFLSGSVFSENKYDFCNFFKKKVKQLLIPCFCFTLISIVIDLIFFQAKCLQIINKYLPGALWFLLVLFLCEVLYIGLCRITNKKLIRICIILLSAFIGVFLYRNHVYFPYSICTLFSAIFFYGIGHISRNQIRKISFPVNNITKFILALICFSVIYIFVRFLNVRTQMIYNQITPPIFGYFSAIIGIYGTVMLSFLISSYTSKINIIRKVSICSKNILNFLGKNTLIILCVHIIYRDIFNYYIFQNIENKLIKMGLLQLFLWVLIYFTISLSNRSKTLSLILGK